MDKRSSEKDDNRFRVGAKVTCFRRGRWWSAEYYADGRQQRRSLGTVKKKVAAARAAKLEAQLAAGTLNSAPKAATVGEVIELYLEKCRTEDRAASTIERYRPELERLQGFFASHGVRKIAGVTLALVEKYRTERKPQVAPTTLYHETVLCKQLTNFAFDRGFVAVNPLKKLKIKRPKQFPRPAYTLEDVERIIVAAGAYADLFELLAFTGLRIGEARWLTWKDVHLDHGGSGGRLHVRAKAEEWRPKDGDDRVVPLHPRVARMLIRRPRRHRFVFTAAPSQTYPQGGHQISDRHVLVSLKRILKRLKIADNTVHGFRHFFVSFCANNGIEPFKLIQWTGHSDLATVMKYYSLSDAESRQAMASMPFDGTAEGAVEHVQAGGQQAQNKHNSGGRNCA